MAYTTIKKPSDYFNTKLYTGTGASQSITGVGFQPDWIWFKVRSETGNHNLFDSIRGSNKILQSSTTIAEATSTDLLTSFDSDGFTVNTDDGVNGSSKTYASWNWLANGAGSANTDGSITSTVSANTTSGFSIVSYTGTGSAATVGHGLGSVPKMIIIKKRNSATGSDWYVYHVSNGNDSKIWLNQTSAKGTGTHMNNTTPTSSVFSIGTPTEVNNSGDTYIAYCFADVTGYSKFGSYTGNGNADGTFVYTGFKPAFTILKRTDATGGWIVADNKRDTFNVAGKFVFAHNSDAEQDLTSSHTPLDLLSNGMKMRSSNLTGTTSLNISGATYIYMAFAEEPLVGDNPCTAR
jgi:hypothetical protein